MSGFSLTCLLSMEHSMLLFITSTKMIKASDADLHSALVFHIEVGFQRRQEWGLLLLMLFSYCRLSWVKDNRLVFICVRQSKWCRGSLVVGMWKHRRCPEESGVRLRTFLFFLYYFSEKLPLTIYSEVCKLLSNLLITYSADLQNCGQCVK
jgi:hypothetical protein